MCPRESTTDEIINSIWEEDNLNLSAGEWFGLLLLSSIHGVARIFRSNYRSKSFFNATAWPYRRFHLERIYRCKKVLEHRPC